MGFFKKTERKQRKEAFDRITKEALEEQKQEKNQINIETISLEQAKDIVNDLDKISDDSYRGSVSYTIFHKSNTIKLYFFADNDEKNLTKEHIELYKSIIENMNFNDDNIVNELKNYYKIDDYKTIEERFRPISIMIFDGGRTGIVFEDLNAEEGWSDREIVVEIKPDISYFGSVEDYA